MDLVLEGICYYIKSIVVVIVVAAAAAVVVVVRFTNY
jgi:hypothetical protein